MRDGLTLPIYLLFFVAPAVLWLGMLVGSRWLRPARWLQTRSLPEQAVARGLIWLVSILMVLRVTAGALALLQWGNLWALGLFYPLRVASPNYHFLAGLPWFALLMAMVWQWPRLKQWIDGSRHRYLALWLIAIAVLLAFAGIEGGIVNGVSGVYTSQEQIDDLQYARWEASFFHEHLQRVAGSVQPPYIASHSVTHPPLSLLIFRLVQPLGAFAMGLLTLCLFAAIVPLLATVIAARGGGDKTATLALLALATPGYLVFGAGSDDALYYLLWTCVLVSGWWGVERRRPVWTLVAGFLIALACNITYASLILIPGVLAFTAQRPFRELPDYLRRNFVSIVSLMAAMLAVLGIGLALTGFNILQGMQTVMDYQHRYLFTTLLHSDPVRAVSERMMTIFDFVIFAGPVMLATWLLAFRQRARQPWLWSIPAVAFVVVVGYIAPTTPGAGETGRGWGGLYVCWWLGTGLWLAQKWEAATLERLLRFALVYAGLFQLVVDFGW